MDIEVVGDNVHLPSVEIAADPIASVSCIDTYNEKVYSFAFRKDIVVDEGKNYAIEQGKYLMKESNKHFPKTERLYKSERKMLMDFVHFISDTDPDILTGWNSNEFDLGYIVHRLRHPRVNLKSYSRYLSGMLKVYVVDEQKSRGGAEASKRHAKKLSGRKRRWRPMMGGRICFDLLPAYENIKGKHEDGLSLNAVMKRELSIEKKTDSIMSEDWYITNIHRFLNYNQRDAEGTFEIDRRVNIIGFHDFIQKCNGCLWDKLYDKSVIVDSFMLMHSQELALPTKIPHKREEFEGALVLDPVPGIYGRGDYFVVYYDLVKMYPNNIRSGNLSPECIVDDSEPDDPARMNIIGNGHRFWKPVRVPPCVPFDPKLMVKIKIDEKVEKIFMRCVQVPEGTKYDPSLMFKRVTHMHDGTEKVRVMYRGLGFVPIRLTEMFSIRETVEAERRKHEYGSYMYINLTGMRQNIKDTINSVYGWMAYPGSRVYAIAIAESITYMGRELTMNTKRIAEENGYKVLYGDTDSNMLLMKAASLDECIEKSKVLLAKIRGSYDKFAKEHFGVDDHFFDIDFENIFSFMMYTSAKKKYVGMLIWNEGHLVYRTLKDGSKKLGQLYYRGIEMRRSDSAWITKEVQKELFTRLGDNEPREVILDYLHEVVQKMLEGEFNNMQIGVPRGQSQNADEYETDSPWLRGSEYSNNYLKGNFKKGSKPKLLYINEVRGVKYPPTNEVCLDFDMDELPADFKVDYETMAEKTIRDKVDFALEALDIHWSELTTGMTNNSLEKWMK